MAVDLQVMHKDLTMPSGLTIQPVADENTFKQFNHAFVVGWGLPDQCMDLCFDIFASPGFDLPLRHYLGLMNGKPVASSSLFLGAGVAGIYNVSTLPEARRQGIGTALTGAALREACTMGYRIGILHSSSMGLEVYRQLGFQEYCKLSTYEWRNETT